MAVSASPTVPTESSGAVPVGGFSTWFKNIGDWIRSISPAGASQYETDWTDITLDAAFQVWGVAPQVRRIGRTAYFRGGAQLKTGNFSASATTVVGTIPGGFIPGYWLHSQSALSVGGNSGLMGSGAVGADGVLTIRVAAGVTANTIALKGLSGYLVD